MNTIIRRRDLPGLHIAGAQLRPEQALFQGRLAWVSMRAGLELHSADYIELENFQTEAVSGERLGFILFLQGGADVSLDDRQLRFGADVTGAAPDGPVGALVSQTRPTTFHRCMQAGTKVRKVVLNFGPEWFETGGLDGYDDYRSILAFRREHLGLRHWRPSARLISLAEDILRPASHTSMMDRIFLESRVLEMSAEVLGVLCEPARADGVLRLRDSRRMQRLRELLDSGRADEWSLAVIAREAGVNINTMQKQFRAFSGHTVFEYLRTRRLVAARRALEQEGVTVAQAAWRAGYNSAANFATAFKREFGITPRQVRR